MGSLSLMPHCRGIISPGGGVTPHCCGIQSAGIGSTPHCHGTNFAGDGEIPNCRGIVSAGLATIPHCRGIASAGLGTMPYCCGMTSAGLATISHCRGNRSAGGGVRPHCRGKISYLGVIPLCQCYSCPECSFTFVKEHAGIMISIPVICQLRRAEHKIVICIANTACCAAANHCTVFFKYAGYCSRCLPCCITRSIGSKHLACCR